VLHQLLQLLAVGAEPPLLDRLALLAVARDKVFLDLVQERVGDGAAGGLVRHHNKAFADGQDDRGKRRGASVGLRQFEPRVLVEGRPAALNPSSPLSPPAKQPLIQLTVAVLGQEAEDVVVGRVAEPPRAGGLG